MKQFSSSFVAVFIGWTTVSATGCGPAESSDVAAEDTDTRAEALADCQINPDGRAFCAATASPTISNRRVFYRIGANTGPGYDAATGRHAAVVLFQGTSTSIADLFGPTSLTGGSNGPGATWGKRVLRNANFGAWYQVATVVALVNAGYTVIQAAARRQPSGAYFWDTNRGVETNMWPGSEDQILMQALIAQMQPSSLTFGSLDINHAYATGISSGGYMSSRIAHEFAAGINGDSTVVSTSQPFRCVAIQSGAYQQCAGAGFSGGSDCIADTPNPLPNVNHPPTFFLHDVRDMVVPIATQRDYFNRLDAQFPGGNAVYTVNGVRKEFLRVDEFTGAESTFPGHQWSSELTADSSNLILQWFNSHR